MTYREYIKAVTAGFGASSADVDVILVNQSKLIPNPDAGVDPLTAKKALCKEFATFLPMASSISEGGYSISWNMDAIRLWYKATCRELGIEDVTKPKVKGRSDLW